MAIFLVAFNSVGRSGRLEMEFLTSGIKLGILEGRHPIHKKGALQLCKEDTAFEYHFADS